MKIKAIVILLVTMLLLSACGTENTESIFTKDTENATSATEPPTEAIKEVSIPKFEFVDNTADILKETAKEMNVEFTETDENIIFSATQNVLSDMAKKYSQNFQKPVDDTSGESKLSYVEISDDFKTVDFYIEDGYDTSANALEVKVFMQIMFEIKMLDGAILYDDLKYTQRMINVNTNEVVCEFVMPDEIASFDDLLMNN